MRYASLGLGILSIFFTAGGAILAFIPYLGGLMAFAAPLCALFGIIFGGIAMSRAKRSGQSDGIALAGVIVGAVAIIPAFLVAAVCGSCNMALSTDKNMKLHKTGDGQYYYGNQPPPSQQFPQSPGQPQALPPAAPVKPADPAIPMPPPMADPAAPEPNAKEETKP